MKQVSNEVWEIAQDLYDDADFNINRYGELESFKVLDYEDYNGYYRDCTEADFEEAKKYLEELLENVKYYTPFNSHMPYLELNDNHTLWNIEVPDDFTGEFNDEEYSILYDTALQHLEEEIGTEVFGLGRSGRHICVEDTFRNLTQLDKFKEAQVKWEQWLINTIEEEMKTGEVTESLNKGEKKARCLSCGADVIYTNRDIEHDIDGDYIECPNCHATFDVDYDAIEPLLNKKTESYEVWQKYFEDGEIARPEYVQSFDTFEEAQKFADGLNEDPDCEAWVKDLEESKKVTEAEDMSKVKDDVKNAVDKSNSTDLEKDQVKGSIDVLKTDEESAIKGYEDFNKETSKVVDKELSDEIDNQMQEIVDDEKEHIEKLDTIKSALGESKNNIGKVNKETGEIEVNDNGWDNILGINSYDDLWEILDMVNSISTRLGDKFYEFIVDLEVKNYIPQEAAELSRDWLVKHKLIKRIDESKNPEPLLSDEEYNNMANEVIKGNSVKASDMDKFLHDTEDKKIDKIKQTLNADEQEDLDRAISQFDYLQNEGVIFTTVDSLMDCFVDDNGDIITPTENVKKAFAHYILAIEPLYVNILDTEAPDRAREILSESKKAPRLTGDETYVARNSSGYKSIGLIVDNTNKQFQIINGQVMTTDSKTKKMSKKQIRDKAQQLYDKGYTEYDGYGSVAQGVEKKTEAKDYSTFTPTNKVLTGNKGLSEKAIMEMRWSLPKYYKNMTDEQKQIEQELFLRSMVMSCLIYGEDIHTSIDRVSVDKYRGKPYVDEYYDKLGKDVTEEIIKQQTDYFKRGKVIHNTRN